MNELKSKGNHKILKNIANDMSPLKVLLACALPLLAAASGGWEYEAVYNIDESADTYSLNMANAADPTMTLCFYKTTTADQAGIEAVESYCHADEASPTDVNAYQAPVTIASGTTYKVNMDTNTWLSVFNFKFPENAKFAMFLQHLPSEFYFTGGTEMEILKDGDSHDVVAAFTPTVAAEDKSSSDGWRDTMLGCLAVWAVTLSGLVLIINMSLWEMLKSYALMFSSGTLMSTAFCLVLYESTHLITDQSSTESIASGRWAAMIMVGFLSSPIFRIILQLIFPEFMDTHSHGNEQNTTSMDVVATEEDPEGDVEIVKVGESDVSKTTVEDKETEFVILFSMIMGDFFHNFSDGIFIGAAFNCDASFAWKMVGITAAHEVPQELGDFAILTGKLGYSTPVAILYNVVSGLSVMLGGIVIMAADVGSKDTGMLLAYGAGNYLYVACVHLFTEVKEVKEMALRLLWFCIGAVAIGLILLDHEHCSVSTGGGDAHAEHAHRL